MLAICFVLFAQQSGVIASNLEPRKGQITNSSLLFFSSKIMFSFLSHFNYLTARYRVLRVNICSSNVLAHRTIYRVLHCAFDKHKTLVVNHEHLRGFYVLHFGDCIVCVVRTDFVVRVFLTVFSRYLYKWQMALLRGGTDSPTFDEDFATKRHRVFYIFHNPIWKSNNWAIQLILF